MRREANLHVFGSSKLDAVLTPTGVGPGQGVGQVDKFKPSDMTGGCLALT